MLKSILVALLGGAAIAAPAAAASSISGSSGGLSWTATSNMVGQSSSSAIAAGGNPIYAAADPAYSGVVGLVMDYGAAGQFSCTGTLLGDRRSIVTAAHCVSGGAGTANPLSTTAYFRAPDANADASIYSGGAGVTKDVVSDYFVNGEYTGEVIDQNDIAVLRLADYAPAYAASYALYGSTDLTGTDFDVAGYGLRSTTGGADGYTGRGAGAGAGVLRKGSNRYDFSWGDADFETFFTDFDGIGGNFFGGTADITYSFLSDFDNGLAANDASCKLVTVSLWLDASPKYCDLGLGAAETSIAGGDSGGPGFVAGMLATVNSYGMTFGPQLGDYKCASANDCLQGSWGEFNGFVPVALHENFIKSSMLPEPASWGMTLVGFGALGASARRRRAITWLQ